MLAACLCPKAELDKSTFAPALFLLPIMAGLLGLINTTEADYASQWLLHFLGAASFCAAIWLASSNDADFLPTLAAVIGIIGLISCIQGWYQHFIGLEAARQFTISQMAEQGVKLTPIILEKLAQTRIYGNFIDPNVYASHLLFCLPFALYFLHKTGLRLENSPKAGSIVLVSAGVILFVLALLWSGSRGAAIGAAAGICAVLWSIPAVRNWRWRWCLPIAGILALACVGGLFFAMKSRDGMASASARLIYYKTALEIFLRHPFAGAGLGEFFPWYLRLKPIEAEITRDPHNILLSFMAQTGIFGGITVAALILFPWIVITFKDKTKPIPPLTLAAAAAMAGWFIHTMFQFNELFPGTLFPVAASCVFLLKPNMSPQTDRNAIPLRILSFACGALCLLALLRVPGELLLRQGEIADAQKPGNGLGAYCEAIEKLPNAVMPPRIANSIFYAQGNWEKAAEAAQILTMRTPHRSSSYLRLSCAQMAMNKLQDAQTALDSALLWQPSSPDALVAMAVLNHKKSTSMTFMDNNTLARQLDSCRSWSYDMGDHVQVKFLEKDNFMLTNILKNASVNYQDGRRVRFVAISEDETP